MSDVAIAVEHLGKVYRPRTSREVHAVDDLSFTVRRGGIFGLLGPNGAGKTTTLRILITLIPPTSGRASVCGFDVVKQPLEVRRRIGVALVQALIAVVLASLLLDVQIETAGIPLLILATIVGTAGWFFFYAIFALRIRRNDAFNTVTSVFYFFFLFASSAAFASAHLRFTVALGIPRALIMVAGVITIYLALVRGLERRQATELGRIGAAQELGAGFLLGAALFSTTLLVLYALGVTAALFGGLHVANAGATVVSTVAIALEAGILLAAAFMYTRRLWLPFGLHSAWNFTEGGIFGAAVSGGRSHGLVVTQFVGSDWLTGGRFGPEASIVAVLVCLSAGVALIVLASRRGRVVSPFWRVKAPTGR